MSLSIVLAILVIGGLTIYMMVDARRRSPRSYHLSSDSEQAALSEVSGQPSFDPALVQTKWNEIGAVMSTPSGLKNALMEADKLLDYVMLGKGFAGETMADRLRMAQRHFHDREAVWAAHKLRNTLAHEVAVDMVAEQIKRAVTDLGTAIRDLGVAI